MTFGLTAKARQDRSDLSGCGLAEWGAERTLAYLDELLACMGRLAEQPGLRRARSELREGARPFPRGMHLILYREIGGRIEILAIPHQSTDPPGYL
ncbi:MAG: type II toxin-antitoxin system RelE/ParE family toxin [Pseudomonadota bacterium]